jgi:hypothetical protein
MVREVFRCQTGVLWDIAQLKKIAKLDAELLYPEVKIPLPRSEKSLSVPKYDTKGEKGEHQHEIGDLHIQQHHHHRPGDHGHYHNRDGSSGTSFSTDSIFGDADELDMRVYDDDEHELQDALSKLTDQLSRSPVWWILEFLPVKGKKQIQGATWKEQYL